MLVYSAVDENQMFLRFVSETLHNVRALLLQRCLDATIFVVPGSWRSKAAVGRYAQNVCVKQFLYRACENIARDVYRCIVRSPIRIIFHQNEGLEYHLSCRLCMCGSRFPSDIFEHNIYRGGQPLSMPSRPNQRTQWRLVLPHSRDLLTYLDLRVIKPK
jgi:hypothetical protein